VGGYVGTSTLFEAEVVLLFKLVHFLISGLILVVDFFLNLRDLVTLIFPALKKDVISEKLVSRVQLCFVTIESLEQVGISFHLKFALSLLLSDFKYLFSLQIFEVFGYGVSLPIIVGLVTSLLFENEVIF
jgi:hypothetical protein